jgi:hypothetical protein
VVGKGACIPQNGRTSLSAGEGGTVKITARDAKSEKKHHKSATRQIPPPAGESAGVRDDLGKKGLLEI